MNRPVQLALSAPEAAGDGGACREPDRRQETCVFRGQVWGRVARPIKTEVETSYFVFLLMLLILPWDFDVDRADGLRVKIRSSDIDRHHAEVSAVAAVLVRRADGADHPERFQRWCRGEQIEAVVELQLPPSHSGTNVGVGVVRLVDVKPLGGDHFAAARGRVTSRDFGVDAPVADELHL